MGIDLKLDDWNEALILDFLSKGMFECDYFDFKETLPNSKDEAAKSRLVNACCSFANSGGGFLIFGVKDDRSLNATARLVGMDPKFDFPALFGTYPQKCEPSINWTIRNPPLQLKTGNVVNIIFIPKSPRGPHSVGKPEQGLKFLKRTNQGTDYMSSGEIKNAYLGYYEKRLKVQLLFAELGDIATDAQRMMLPDKQIATHYPFIEFNLSILETIYPEVFTLIYDNSDLVERLMRLRNLCKTANSCIAHFLRQAMLPRGDQSESIKMHNLQVSSYCREIITDAGQAMKELQPYRL